MFIAISGSSPGRQPGIDQFNGMLKADQAILVCFSMGHHATDQKTMTAPGSRDYSLIIGLLLVRATPGTRIKCLDYQYIPPKVAGLQL